MRKLLKNLGVLLTVAALLLINFAPTFEALITKYVYADYKPGWGVLAVNTDKSIYKVGDTAKFEYAVLDDFGGMVCRAKVEMQLTNKEFGVEEVFSTENGKIKVNEECQKKEYVENSDFESTYVLEEAGTYEIEITAEIAAGKYTIKDSFKVVDSLDFDVERNAPTRIYPPENYPVKLKVTADKDFSGLVVDRVPYSFEITEDSGFVVEDVREEDHKKIIWEVDWTEGNIYELKYEFKAPKKSPEYYEIGELSFIKNYSWLEFLGYKGYKVFEESRSWQIASDSANELLLFWDDSLGGSVPAGWTSESDAAETYENVFIRGAATPGGTGGAANHNHTASISNVSTYSTTPRKKGTGTQAGTGSHTHSASSITSVAASNLPRYKTLMVIKSIGATTTIPQYAVAIFDADPGGDWTRFVTQDSQYIYGASSAGTTGGNSLNQHNHNTTSISLTTVSGTTNQKEGNNTTFLSAVNTHTHSSNDVTATTTTIEPAYKNTLLYYPATGSATAPTGLVAMFDTSPLPSDWDTFSDLDGYFMKPASTFGGTGGQGSAHTHISATGNSSLEGSGSFDDEGTGGGSSMVDLAHTHTFDVDMATLGGETYLPPYVEVMMGKYNPASTIYTQNDFEWFVTEDSVTLSNIWPAGSGENIAENTAITPIPFGNEPLASADKIRIQMNVTITGVTLAADSLGFKLWYDAADDCTTASGWEAVGATNAGTIWRLFDESSIGVSDTNPNDISTSTASAEGYYSEINVSDSTPNEVLVSESSEWDWPVENNGAADNTNYCFRMTVADDTLFDSYPSDSFPQLATAPGTADQMRHGSIFTGGSEQGFYWAD